MTFFFSTTIELRNLLKELEMLDSMKDVSINQCFFFDFRLMEGSLYISSHKSRAFS